MRPALWIACLALSLAAGGCVYRVQSRATGWLLVNTEHVRLRTNVSSERARQLAVELQRVRDALSAVALRCALRDRPEPLQVTVLRASEFREIVPEGFVGGYRQWTAGWLAEYQGHIVLPDDLDRDARQVYQHELTHHLVASCLPRTPLWLAEGLAKFLETAVVEEGKVTLGLPPYVIERHRRPPDEGIHRGVRVVRLSRDSIPPLRRLVALGSKDFYLSGHHGSIQTEGNYAAAWALVHMLELGADDLHPRFQAFLKGLTAPDADHAAVFAREFAGVNLQGRLDAYLAVGDMAYVDLPAAAPRRAAPRVRALTRGQAHVHRAWLWSGAPDREEARGRIREHLAAARRDPHSRARARVVSATVLAIAGDFAAAEHEIADGLRRDPDDPELLHAHADLLLRRRADASAIANPLRKVARTADQICTVARIDLMQGQVKRALALATRGLDRDPSSALCRKCVEVASSAIVSRPGS